MNCIKNVITSRSMYRLMESTKNMIDKDALSLMKENVVVLNFSRDVLVRQ